MKCIWADPYFDTLLQEYQKTVSNIQLDSGFMLDPIFDCPVTAYQNTDPPKYTSPMGLSNSTICILKQAFKN